MHGSRSIIPNKKSRPYIYDVNFLALLGAPYVYDISRLRVKVVAYAIHKSTALTDRVDCRVREGSLGCLVGNNPKTLASGSHNSDVRLL
jgi:hypothetical protein